RLGSETVFVSGQGELSASAATRVRSHPRARHSRASASALMHFGYANLSASCVDSRLLASPCFAGAPARRSRASASALMHYRLRQLVGLVRRLAFARIPLLRWGPCSPLAPLLQIHLLEVAHTDDLAHVAALDHRLHLRLFRP